MSAPLIVIKPRRSLWQFDWTEIWQFRDLFYFLMWRDLKVKYKQTIIGVAWAVFQPLVTMLIFTIFFGKLANMPSDGIPYPIFVYTGLLFWILFSSSLSAVSGSFVGNQNIVTKIYFPRIILPSASVLTNLVDFAISSVILVGLMVYYGFAPSLLGFALLPLLILITMFSALGVGLLFASLNVKYRDVQFVLPFFIQLLIFVAPVIYPASIIGEQYQWLLGINPMAGVIDTARATLLNQDTINGALLLTSSIATVVYSTVGYMYFRSVEQYFADVI
jgi:lipopolysaccharide transport system permease protein